MIVNGKTNLSGHYLHAGHSLQNLLEIIEKLRSPGGCLWDIRQKKEDVGRYLLEEAYEVVDAIDSGSPGDLKEELGDILFQILFLARISEETGEFRISDVIETISEKIILRHPHVFGNKKVKDINEIKTAWEEIKKGEGKNRFLFDQIPKSMPPLLMAQKITERASLTGFDWENVDGILKKVEEELEELRVALKSKGKKLIEEEIGDIIFSMVNLSRFVEVSAYEALRSSIRKFADRFSYIESKLKNQGKTLSGATLEEMDHLWNESKKSNRSLQRLQNS